MSVYLGYKVLGFLANPLWTRNGPRCLKLKASTSSVGMTKIAAMLEQCGDIIGDLSRPLSNHVADLHQGD